MSKQQNWFAVDVETTIAAVEAVESALSEADADGTEYSTLGQKEAREIAVVIGYFAAEPNLNEVKDAIVDALNNRGLPIDSVREISVRAVENQDWLAEWKKHWRPTETAKFIVAPTWSEIAPTDKIILRIEPGMAFGTGTHETTQLCLRAIEGNYQPAQSFLDVGTGTGVLAIAAAKVNDELRITNYVQIVGCDTDFDSVTIARENAVVNAVGDLIEFNVGSIDRETARFDFVAANLTADVIVPMLPLLIEKFEKTLVLSGILREQQDWVTAELRRLNVADWQIEQHGEWISILVER